MGILESKKGVYFDGSNTTNRILDVLEEKRPKIILNQFSVELEGTGGFYVMAVIMFKNSREKLELEQYLPIGSVVTDPSTISTNPAAYWTDYAMKQAQYWARMLGGGDTSTHSSSDIPSSSLALQP